MESGIQKFFFLALAVALIGEISTASVNQTTEEAGGTPTTAKPTYTTPKPTPTNTAPLTTQPTPEELCRAHNTSCSDCLGVSGAKCLWCKTDSSCQPYPVKKILPTNVCALDQARWGVCWLNFEAMIISVSVIGGVIILSLFCCIVYCCCCRKGSSRKYEKEDARYNSQKMERKAKADERKAERKERLDEIRRKYGLMKDEPYQRFDA